MRAKRARWLLPILVLPMGCATLNPPAPESAGGVPARAGANATESLLVYRERLCAGAAGEREQWLASLAGEAGSAQQLQRLLLTSCEPWRARDQLQSALQAAGERQDWSAEEAAWLRLLQSQHEALEQQRQETVRGISEIEDAIEQRPAGEPLQQESRP